MPDVVIVGGGIIGAASAYELARAGASVTLLERDELAAGASVTLLERDELAAGASGRNLGYVDPPSDPALVPLAVASVEIYLELTRAHPCPCTWTARRSARSRSPWTRRGSPPSAPRPSRRPASARTSSGSTATRSASSSRRSRPRSSRRGCSTRVAAWIRWRSRSCSVTWPEPTGRRSATTCRRDA